MNLESLKPNGKLILGLAVGTVLTATVFSIVLLLQSNQAPKQSLTDSTDTNPLAQSSNFETPTQSSTSYSSNSQSSRSTDRVAIEEPLQKWKDLVNDDVADEGQIVDLIHTAQELVHRLGWEALNQIEGSLSNLITYRAVLESVVSDAARTLGFQNIFYAAAEVLRGQIRNDVMSIIVRDWPAIDSIGTLAAATTLSDERERMRLRRIALAQWAVEDHESLSDFMRFMPDELSWYAQFVLDLENSKSTPATAVSMFKEPIESETEKILAQTIAENWSKEDPDAALKWATEQEFVSLEVKNRVLATVLYNIAKEDPKRAIALALDQPVGVFGIGVEGYLIEKLVSTDFEQANALLSEVRAGTTALYASRIVGVNHVLDYNFEEALKIGRTLKQIERGEYFESIFHHWAQTHPLRLFEMLDEMPTFSILSLASMHLIEFNDSMQALSEDQVAALHANLTKEHRSMMLNRRAMQVNVPPMTIVEEFGDPQELAVIQQQMQQTMEIAVRHGMQRVHVGTPAHSHEH